MKRNASTMTDMDFKYFTDNSNDNNRYLKYIVRRRSSALSKPFGVTWKDLTYTVSKNSKTILNAISGYFISGQIMAIMGPSGCGKSSLLTCISGQKEKGVTGTITISTRKHIAFAFIAQENYLLNKLKIRESLIYASQLKNGVNADHRMIANNVMNKLMVNECADIHSNRCSGGQMKRISIALELVSRPNVLILDEPTSGLDTVTAWQLINTLVQLTQQSEPLAIVVTVHQPSARLFNLFNSVYLLSSEGQCIYRGSPLNILNVFKVYGLECPEFNNPSDYALEVSAKEHGVAKVMMLSVVTQIEALEMKDNKFRIKVKHQYRTGRHIWLLTLRSFQTQIRDPLMLWLKIFGFIICSLLISIMYGTQSGLLSGCSSDFNIGDGKELIKKMNKIFADIFENCAGIGFVCMFGWFTAIFPVLLLFPKEVKVFLKEYGNGYYSCFSYFMSKVLSDIPFQLLLPNLGSIPVYYLTGQYSQQVWRVYSFAIIFILISFNASAQGFLISVLFPDNPMVCAFVGLLSIIPMLLLSGIMIQMDKVHFYFRWISHINYIKYGLQSALINIYGFNRCNQLSIAANETDLFEMIPTDKLMEIYSSDKINADLLLSNVNSVLSGITGENHSLIMNYFKLEDFHFYTSILALVLNMIIFRVLAYLLILRKVHSKK